MKNFIIKVTSQMPGGGMDIYRHPYVALRVDGHSKYEGGGPVVFHNEDEAVTFAKTLVEEYDDVGVEEVGPLLRELPFRTAAEVCTRVKKNGVVLID